MDSSAATRPNAMQCDRHTYVYKHTYINECVLSIYRHAALCNYGPAKAKAKSHKETKA